MNQEDPKPGVVIDVEPEIETPEAEEQLKDSPDEQPGEKEKKSSGGSSLPALLLSLIALIAVGVVGYFGYEYWNRINADLAAINARIVESDKQQQQLSSSVNAASSAIEAQKGSLGEQREVLSKQQQAVEAAKAAFKQQEEKLAEENLRLQEREAELRTAVADVHKRVGRSGTQWIIAETEYLIRIASDRLILADDTETARIALELADQRLRDTKDPGWTGVREQIARDIAELSTFDAPDTTGLSARLSALIEQIPQLKISRATIGAERTLPEQVARKPGERNWETLVEDVWAGFRDSVRIRERDKPVQAMLAPEHQFFLYENLKLHLEAARLGLARGDQTLFRDNLATAKKWLGQYFNPTDGTAAGISKAVTEMQQVEIKPEMPDISQSLRALRARMTLMEEIVADGGETAE